VRADTLPLVLPVMGAEGLARGARVRVRLGEVDEITLDITGTVIERLDDLSDGQAGNEAAEDDADDAGISSHLTLAIDLDEGPSEEAAAPASAG
jgi:exoribonuclease II